MALKKMVNGIEVTLSKKEEAETLASWAAAEALNAATAYKAQRLQAYADIGDQLDMLWHAMDSGEIPKSMAFYKARQDVKAKFPKPTGVTNV